MIRPMTPTGASPSTRLRCGRLGVIATGILLAAVAAAPAASARKLTLGKSGADVRHVQERLAELSYLPRGAASGERNRRSADTQAHGDRSPAAPVVAAGGL